MNNKFQKDYSRIVAKAWADPAFEKELIANPTATLKKENITVPPSVNLHVVKNTKKDIYMILPPKPAEGELDMDALKKVAGGSIFTPHCC